MDQQPHIRSIHVVRCNQVNFVEPLAQYLDRPDSTQPTSRALVHYKRLARLRWPPWAKPEHSSFHLPPYSYSFVYYYSDIFHLRPRDGSCCESLENSRALSPCIAGTIP